MQDSIVPCPRETVLSCQRQNSSELLPGTQISPSLPLQPKGGEGDTGCLKELLFPPLCFDFSVGAVVLKGWGCLNLKEKVFGNTFVSQNGSHDVTWTSVGEPQLYSSDGREWNLSPGLLSSLERTSYTPIYFCFFPPCVFV
ncbi:UNVERIFIED_CONTAM: hypothetical protein K2H54_032342 [Gekko kuhli]